MEESVGTKVRVTPEPDPARILRAIDEETDMLFLDLGEVGFYYRGLTAFSDLPKANFYAVWFEYDPCMGYLVRGDSEWETIYDLKEYVEQGNKIRSAHFAPAAGWSMRALGCLAAFLGVPEESIEPVPFGSIRDLYYSVPDGKADVVNAGMSGGTLVEIMAKPHGVKFLDLPATDRAGWERLLEVLPTEWPAQVNDWGAVEEFVGIGCMVAPALYFALPSLDEELVYQLAKWIDENYDDYKGTCTEATRMSLERFREYLDISCVPVHPGTVKYLKEIGEWTSADDTWNEAAKALMQRYVDAWEEASAEASANNIKIEMGNKDWEDLWASYVKDIPPLKTRY